MDANHPNSIKGSLYNDGRELYSCSIEVWCETWMW